MANEAGESDRIEVRQMMAGDAHPDVWGLVVASSHRRRGIGARLMAAAEDWARKRD